MEEKCFENERIYNEVIINRETDDRIANFWLHLHSAAGLPLGPERKRRTKSIRREDEEKKKDKTNISI